MKAVFILLLLTNIIFALVQWWFPYEREEKRSPLPVAAETLRLLDEMDETTVVVDDPVNDPANDPQQPPTRSTTDDTTTTPAQLCYTLGPFKNQQSAKEVALKFKQNQIAVSSRSSLEKEYMGVMVYIAEHASRAEALKTAKSLAAKGVQDYIIVNKPGRSNILSLGVFGLKKNADRRLKYIASLGYPVKTEARYRNRTIYWLDYSESENESLTRFINRLKKQKGISRISRQCAEKLF